MAVTRHSSQLNGQKKKPDGIHSASIPMTIRTRSSFKRQQQLDANDINNTNAELDAGAKRPCKRFKTDSQLELSQNSVKYGNRMNSYVNDDKVNVVVSNTGAKGGFFDSDEDIDSPVSPTDSVFSTDENAYDTAASPGDSLSAFPLKKLVDFDRLNDADQFLSSDESSDEYDFFDLPDNDMTSNTNNSKPLISFKDQSDIGLPEDNDTINFDVFDTEQSINTMPDLSEPLALDNRPVFKSFDESEMEARSPTWPMEDDETLFFSVLVNKKPNYAAAPNVAQNSQPSITGLTSKSDKLDESPSIEEFVDYDSAESTSPTDTESSSWIDKYHKIPISGFRLASYQQPLTSYYRQNTSTKGLNRRALWSGRARQMLGGFAYH